MSIDHPVLLEINSLKQALSQFQNESHSTSIKLQHASLSLSNLQQLQQTNNLLSSELSTLRSHSLQFSPSSSSSGETVEGLTLSLRELSSKLSICEEQLFGKMKELGLLNLEMKKSRSMIESAYELASRIRGREESSKSYSVQLQLKLDLVEEKNRMSERALLEYANLVRSLSDKSRISTTTRQNVPIPQVHENNDRRIEELLKEHMKEKEVLEKRISELEYSLDVTNASLNSEKKAQQETLSHVAQLETQILKIERDDSTAAKMVSRYMKFTQKQTEGLHTTLTTLQTRHKATLSTLHSQISTLSSLLNDSSNDNTRLRNALDELGLEILKESYGRRREVVQRIKLARREERIGEGLRRWLRKSEERLRRFEDHTQTNVQLHFVQEEMLEMIQDAKIIVDALNSPSFSPLSLGTDPENENEPFQFIISGSNAKLSLIQSQLDDLFRELQMEKERRVSLEVMLVKGVEDDCIPWPDGHEQNVDMYVSQNVEDTGNKEEKSECRKEIGTQTIEEKISVVKSTTTQNVKSELKDKDTHSLSLTSIPEFPANGTIPDRVEERLAPIPQTKDVGANMVNTEIEQVKDEAGEEGIGVVNVVVEAEDDTKAQVEEANVEEEQTIVEVKGEADTGVKDEADVEAKEEAEVAVEIEEEEGNIEAVESADTTNDRGLEVEVRAGVEEGVNVDDEVTEIEAEPLTEGPDSDKGVANSEIALEYEPNIDRCQGEELKAIPGEEVEAKVGVDIIEPNPISANDVDVDIDVHSFENTPGPEPVATHPILSSDPLPTLTQQASIPSTPLESPVGTLSPRSLQPIHSPIHISLPTTHSSLPSPSPPTPPPAAPTHPLLIQLKTTQTRYDYLQRAFHDCHIALEDLKSSLSSSSPNTITSSQSQSRLQNSISFPSGVDNKKEEERKAVLKAIVSRLDDFTEDVRVELEIRIADEQVLGVGYEALLLVPGALLFSSSSTSSISTTNTNANSFPSSSSFFSTSFSSISTKTLHMNKNNSYDNVHDNDDEAIPNTKTLESQIQSFIDGTDPVISKALHTFEKKLDDLAHDLGIIKRAVYNPSSSSSPSPSPSPSHSPSPSSSPLPSSTSLPLPTDPNTNETSTSSTGGGWSSWIRTPTSSLLSLPSTLNLSRPSTPTPTSSSSSTQHHSLKPMTFGEIMTSPRKPPQHNSHHFGSSLLNRSTSTLSLKSATSMSNLKGGGGGIGGGGGGGGGHGRRESQSQNQNQNHEILKYLNLNLNLNLRIPIPLSHLPIPINHSTSSPHKFAGQKGFGLGLPLHLQQLQQQDPFGSTDEGRMGSRIRTTSSSSMYRLGMGMGMSMGGGFGTGMGIGGGGIGFGMGVSSPNQTPRRVVSATFDGFGSKESRLGSAPLQRTQQKKEQEQEQQETKVDEVDSDIEDEDKDEDGDEEREDID